MKRRKYGAIAIGGEPLLRGAKEISSFMKISIRTFHNYRKINPEFDALIHYISPGGAIWAFPSEILEFMSSTHAR